MRRITIRRMIVAIALIAASLALVANERWRWGYPRRVPYNQSTAVGWLKTVIRSDFRMYDGGDVQSLMNYIADTGLLIGKTKGQIVTLLGPPESPENLPSLGLQGMDCFYVVGIVPRGIRAGPPTLVFQFDHQGKCIKITPYASY